MKAPSRYYKIWGGNSPTHGHWEVRELVGDGSRRETGKVVWKGKTFRGARNAHYRFEVAKITGKPVSAAQARRSGNG